LTDEQIKYAAEDVVYLPALYDYQTSRLKELGREQWAECELKELQDIEDFDVDPYKRFIHLKSASHLKPFELCLAREVAAWREFRAMKYDIPRRWVLSDELVSEICKRNPYTIESLFSIRGMRDVVSISEAREILGCLKKAREVEESEWPSIAVPGLTEQKVSEAVSLMNALLRLRAKENELPPQVLATNEQLTDLARGKLAGNKLLDTWRKDIIGNELIDLLHGKIAISINDNSLVVHEL
jgi:ribonuclease D